MFNYEQRRAFIKKIILIAVIFGGIVALFVPTLVGSGGAVPAYAASASPTTGAQPIDPCQAPGGAIGNCKNGGFAPGSGLDAVIRWILNLAKALSLVCVALSVLFIMIGSFFMIWAFPLGNADSFKKGVETVRNAIAGLIVSVLAFTIVSFIANGAINFDFNLGSAVQILSQIR
jgi:hypothetical protein